MAVAKGYDDKKYLWITFFLSIVGVLLVIALPVRNDYEKTVITEKTDKTQTSEELSEINNVKIKQWSCPKCYRINPGNVSKCLCGTHVSKGTWLDE